MRIINDSFLWKRVLMALYTGLLLHKEYGGEAWSPHDILDMRLEKFDEQILYLKEHHLIEMRDDNFYYLTKKGFNVAFELEKQEREIKIEKRNEKLQLFTLYLTVILVSTSMVNFAKEIYPSMSQLIFWGYLILMTILVFSMPFKFRKR